jgi:predicted acyl esterase
MTLTLYPTRNLFMPGHRIRLDVPSSNFPRFDVNPNTGEAIGREQRRVVTGPSRRGGRYPNLGPEWPHLNQARACLTSGRTRR